MVWDLDLMHLRINKTDKVLMAAARMIVVKAVRFKNRNYISVIPVIDPSRHRGLDREIHKTKLAHRYGTWYRLIGRQCIPKFLIFNVRFLVQRGNS